MLKPKEGESFLDVTAGYGGHAEAILERTKRPDLAVLVDRDDNAIEELNKSFGSKVGRIIHEDFYKASKELLNANKRFDLIIADLGVSSPHLNEGSRGFSFQQDGPLDMRMDRRQAFTADTIINIFSKEEIDDILKTYGEEKKASIIADTIVKNRPIHSTSELSALVAAVYGKHTHHNPATKTFQALRVVVNDELKLLTNSLPLWINLLAPNGRLAVISFHSIEDRIVKQFFASHSGNRYDSTLKLLTKHPIRARPSELVHNPRARSAKFRAVVK